MVDDTSTWHQHRRRRRKNTNYPSAALLASLAAFIPPAVLARPVLLPFLYPSIPQSTSTSSSPPQQQQPAPSHPRQKRSAEASTSTSSFRQPTATASQPSASEQRRAERIANHFQPDDTGHYKPACWSLHGQSNCPRDDTVNGTIGEPDVHEVVPGQPDFTPTSTSGPSTSTTPPSPTTTSPTSTATASPSTTTVEPYTMTFNVENIPPGWQKNARTSFYSKNLIIGFSVTLAALICLTIVLCVIWRIRVARARRESERALKEKKKELGIASQTSDDTSSIDHDQDHESTRQRGLRRRRANVRAGDEDDDSDDDNDDGDDDQRREGAAMSEKNGMTPSGRKRRTAFMRTFSGKVLAGPTKWRRNKKRRQQEQEEEEEEEDRARGEVEEDGERDERQEQSGRRDTIAASIPPPLETQNSFSPLLAHNSTSMAVEAPIPLSPPPPPPVNLQPPPAATSPLRNGEDEEDDDDPTSVQPPAYRRRNFGLRSRAAPAPTTATPMSARALEKQREAGDVPEEYMYMAGMMPPPLPSSTVVANDASLVLERSRSVGLPPVEQDRDDEEEEDGDEEAPRREDVTAHLAMDDKSVLARLHQSGSAPSAPPAELDALEEGGSHVMPVVPEEVEMYDLEDAQGSASGSSHLPPPTTPASFLPAPPTITSAHLFVPPPPQSAEHEDGSELPRYVAGPSAPSLLGRSEKLSTADAAVPGPSELPALLPSAPPAEHDQVAASAAGLIVPSAPPMVEDGEVQELASVPSAPPLETDESSVPRGEA